MKKSFITFVLTFFVVPAFSQVDSVSIEQQILNYADAQSVIISKGRRLLLGGLLKIQPVMLNLFQHPLILLGDCGSSPQ